MTNYNDVTLLKNKNYSEQRKYWLQQLSDLTFDPILDIENNKRLVVESKDIIKFTLESSLVEKLLKMSNHMELTLYTILLASFKCSLFKYTGKSDLWVITPFLKGNSGEDSSDDGLIIRNILLEELSIKEVFHNVKESIITAFNNKDYEFGSIINELEYKNHYFQNGNNNIAFFSEKLHGKEPRISKKSNLVVSYASTEKIIKVVCKFNARIYTRQKIENLFRCFITALDTCINNLEMKLSSLDILSKEDRKNLTINFNKTEMKYPRQHTINQLFEKQANETPDRIAVVSEDRQLTYRELNEEANKLARILKKRGSGTDSVIAIMVDRSLEMIIGIMAILKSGGAYLPIDIKCPEQRMRYMLQDSNARFLLVQDGVSFSEELPVNIINITKLEDEKSQNFYGGNVPSSLAYIIYTSGSTGEPKGVMIEHRNVINLVTSLSQNIFGLYSNVPVLKVALVAPYMFDASVQQIFSTLLFGHELHIIPEDVRFDGEQLKEYYRENLIDVSDGTPIHLNMLANTSSDFDENIKIKHFIIGGDALLIDSVKKFFGKFKNNIPYITNVYGPTECCVDSTSYLIKADTLNEIECIPIGKPMGNVKIYILGKSLEVVPVGVIGEIYISGNGVGRGYINRDDLTIEKFIENPFIPGEKMYKTGDLGKWLPEGEIEFFGRIDHQVKIRGFRIELDEIETQLLKYDLVKDVTVIAKTDNYGNKYISAFVTSGQELAVTELRKHLSKVLPDYMIPSYFVQIDKMPLTNNGKIDRNALPDPKSNINIGVEYVPPKNEIEEILVSTCEKVLEIKKIGINDDFFSLGGDSLKLIQLLVDLRAHNLDLQLKDVYKCSRICELSQHVQRSKAMCQVK